MMTRRSAVIVEIDAVVNCRLDEAQHRRALMLDGVAVVADRPVDAEVDAEASAETLHAGREAVAREDSAKSAVKTVRQLANVLVKARLSIGSNRRQGRSHGDNMAVVCAAVLAIAGGHEPFHDVAPAA